MQRKSPLFLLEIVIAMFLVGIFSAYFLRSSIGYLYQERKALLEMEFEREADLKRMEFLTSNWNGVDNLPQKEGEAKEESRDLEVKLAGKSYFKTKKFKVFCPKQHGNAYDLVIKEDGKKYHFLVKKSEAKT
jgi:hypothetical protein